MNKDLSCNSKKKVYIIECSKCKERENLFKIITTHNKEIIKKYYDQMNRNNNKKINNNNNNNQSNNTIKTKQL